MCQTTRVTLYQSYIFPGYCFCKGAPDVEVDIRQQVQKVMFDLCPRGEMNRCLCEDNSKITFPFNLMELLPCRPKKVTYLNTSPLKGFDRFLPELLKIRGVDSH